MNREIKSRLTIKEGKIIKYMGAAQANTSKTTTSLEEVEGFWSAMWRVKGVNIRNESLRKVIPKIVNWKTPGTRLCAKLLHKEFYEPFIILEREAEPVWMGNERTERN